MAVIDQNLCIGCGLCVPYCPMGAISIEEKAIIDLDKCVECSTCFRSKVCPVNAISMVEDLEYPRSLRRYFSDPTTRHRETSVPGRGTEEIKTNDVTGRFKVGEVGLCIELGRPGIGATFRDVQRLTITLANMGLVFEAKNPMTSLITDRNLGTLKPEILDERVLSVIVEAKVGIKKLSRVLQTLKEVSREIDTVFSLGVISKINSDGTIPVLPVLENLGIHARPNAKINIGVGKPLVV